MRSLLSVLVVLLAAASSHAGEAKRYLYVVCPGIRDYLEFGGAGILVFDIDDGHKFVKRIATDREQGREAATTSRASCANAATEEAPLHHARSAVLRRSASPRRRCWEKELPQGCDRMAITPDGKTLYVPSFEKDTWNVVDAATGNVLATIETKSGAHNTIVRARRHAGVPGRAEVAAPVRRRHEDAQGRSPRSGRSRRRSGRSRSTAAQTLCFVNVNELLGFEVGDLKTGKKLHRVEVQGFKTGHGEAARLPEPRHRPDAGREGSLGRATRSTAGCTSSTPRRCRRSRRRASSSASSRAG